MSSLVEVPAKDLQSGAALKFPGPGLMCGKFTVHYTDEAPKSAYVAVEHRGGWYYLDETDQRTKQYFKMLASLWSAAMSNSIKGQTSTPVLTVPVSR